MSDAIKYHGLTNKYIRAQVDGAMVVGELDTTIFRCQNAISIRCVERDNNNVFECDKQYTLSINDIRTGGIADMYNVEHRGTWALDRIRYYHFAILAPDRHDNTQGEG